MGPQRPNTLRARSSFSFVIISPNYLNDYLNAYFLMQYNTNKSLPESQREKVSKKTDIQQENQAKSCVYIV